MEKVKNYRKSNGLKFFPYYFGKTKNVFKYIYNIFKSILAPKSVLYATGSHIITGYPGTGKTLLMNKIISSVDNNKYFFVTNVDEFSGHENVYKLDICDIFNGKKQVKRIPQKDNKGRYLYGVIFDEINLNFNKRINQSKEYNDLFIGLIEMVVTHRHQKIPRIYFIGQKLELQDTQLNSLFKYQHDIISCVKRFKYWKYQHNYIERVPVKLEIMHRLKDNTDLFLNYQKDKVKIYWSDLLSYDTLALGKNYVNLDKIKL